MKSPRMAARRKPTETAARIVSEIHSRLGATAFGGEVAFIRTILMEEGDFVQLRLYWAMGQVCKKCTGCRAASERASMQSHFFEILRCAPSRFLAPGLYFPE
jgi:hypothetical protein